MDQGLAIVVATSIVALIYLALAVSHFARKRMSMGAVRLFAAVLFGGGALFLAFQIGLL